MNILAYIIMGGDNWIIGGLIDLVIIGLIFWLLFWLITYVALPEPFAEVAKVVLAVAPVIVPVNFLMGLNGHAFIVR